MFIGRLLSRTYRSVPSLICKPHCSPIPPACHSQVYQKGLSKTSEAARNFFLPAVLLVGYEFPLNPLFLPAVTIADIELKPQFPHFVDGFCFSCRHPTGLSVSSVNSERTLGLQDAVCPL